MTQFEMQFFPDEPITEAQADALGFSDFAMLIRNSIIRTKSPFVYGVLGDWGAGKTSILNLLYKSFDDGIGDISDSCLIPIWFNAWKYENEANIVYPLLHTIKKSYQDRMGKTSSEQERFRDALRDAALASAFVLGDLGLRGATKFLTGDAYKLEELKKEVDEVRNRKDELEQVLSLWTDSVLQLEEAFAKLLQIYAEDIAKKHYDGQIMPRFVIFIDDLDRCLPETTIKLLESIKNYLSNNLCIYVLGLNPRVVYLGIRHKYNGLAIEGREYLEKILNYTFYVPEPESQQLARFATARIEQLVTDEQVRQKFKAHFETFGKIIRDSFFNNPRKIKRVLNRYLLFLSKFVDKYELKEMDSVVRLLVIAEYFPDIFQVYLSNEFDDIKDVVRIGSDKFSINDFENKFKIVITPIYPQLSRMKELFKFNPEVEKDIRRPHLRDIAQDVFSITRLV